MFHPTGRVLVWGVIRCTERTQVIVASAAVDSTVQTICTAKHSMLELPDAGTTAAWC
jgi:hypothetical protein